MTFPQFPQRQELLIVSIKYYFVFTVLTVSDSFLYVVLNEFYVCKTMLSKSLKGRSWYLSFLFFYKSQHFNDVYYLKINCV